MGNNRNRYFRYIILNKFSFTLLQMLKWPRAMLFIFETEREASLCLRTLFPNPDLLEQEKLGIRVKVMPLADIDWNFQSSLIGFRSFPARSWLHFYNFYNVPTSSETCRNVPT